MINHIKNLLLNTQDVGDKSEGIPIGFTPFAYNSQLKDFHNLIVPARLSRFYRKFMVYVYLRVMDSAGLSEDVKNAVDSRITYDLHRDKSEFFQFNRISNVKMVSPATPLANDLTKELRIHGRFIATNSLDNFYQRIRVKQIGSSLDITISALDDDDKVIVVHNTSSTLAFDGASNTNFSQTIPVGKTGLSVSFYSPNNWTTVNGSSSAEKEWEFIVETVIDFNLLDQLNMLESSPEIVERMLRCPSRHDTSKYDNMWRQHFNSVYRLAGLIMSFALRADNPDNRT